MRRVCAWLVCLVCCGGQSLHAQGPPPARILVMPFENPSRDARILWLSEAASILIADGLNGLGAVAITREEREQAFRRLQVPPVTMLTDATVIRIGQIVGAARVVIGSLEFQDREFVVRARMIGLESGRVDANVTDRAELSGLFPLFERVARAMVPEGTVPRTPSVVQEPAPTVAVFENYVKGLLAETPDTAVDYLNAALALQRGFDRARLALWGVYAERGEYQRALDAVRPIGAASPSKRRAEFLSGLSQLRLRRYDDAFATFKALADAQPTPTVMNNLGVVQLRRNASPQSGLPAYFFTKASEAEPGDPDYLFNLGYAYWEAKDPQASIYWLREALRRNPADGEAHFVLAAALTAAGNIAQAARERDLARRLSSIYEQWEKRPASDPVPKGLERVKSEIELPRAFQVDAVLAQGEQRSQLELARFYLARAQRLFREENDRDALAELNKVLYLSPYLADAHLLLGRIHLRNGRLEESIDAFKISLWSAESAAAHAALAGAYLQVKDLPAARAEVERAVILDPSSDEARRVHDMLKSAQP